MELSCQVVTQPVATILTIKGMPNSSHLVWRPGRGKHVCHHVKDGLKPKDGKPHVHDYRWTISMRSMVEGELSYYQALVNGNMIFPAYTLVELVYRLPIEINGHPLFIQREQLKWKIGYFTHPDPILSDFRRGQENICDAAADLALALMDSPEYRNLVNLGEL